MAVYRGVRIDDGTGLGDTVVSVDGEPLPLRLDLRKHSPTGFEWGYGGSGPAQLALAILAHHFYHKTPWTTVLARDVFSSGRMDARHHVRKAADQKALRHYQDFKAKVVAGFDKNEWTLTTAQIDGAVNEESA